jgi:hypothetical protein
MAMITTVTATETTTAITTGIMMVFEILAVTGNSGYERDRDRIVRH